MSNLDFLTRRGAIRRRRWSVPNERLPQISTIFLDSSTQNDGSEGSFPRVGRQRRPTLPAIHVSRFREDIDSVEPSSPFSYTHTPEEFLPEPITPIPSSPVPSYHSLTLYKSAARQLEIDVGGLSRASTASPSSLPDYDRIEGGPPTAYPGYSNYAIPGMEMEADDEEIWIDLEPSYWIPAPFITDPSMPRCPGLLDGSCPIREAHNSGSYFLERRAPSARLVALLAHHNVQHLFEGNCPPAAVWAALLRRLTGSENHASENLLFRFRWWHCPDYRARIVARRQPTLDIRQSTVYARRANRQALQEWNQINGHEATQDGELFFDQIQSLEDNFTQEDNIASEGNDDDLWDAYNLWDAYFNGNNEPDTTSLEEDRELPFSLDDRDEPDERSEHSVSDIDSVSPQHSDLVEEPRADTDEEYYIDSTYFFLPVQIRLGASYHRYGFTLPSDLSMIDPPANLPSYLPCLSSLCPVRFPHAQGPFWDSGPLGIPTSLIPGPMAHLRAAPNLAAYHDAIAEHGLGDLFGADTSPPMFILAAVERIVDGNPQPNDLQTVERFRFFHCRACRPIVMPDEEIERHEEDEAEAPPTPSTQCSEVSDLEEEEGVMDSDDWAQYFD